MQINKQRLKKMELITDYANYDLKITLIPTYKCNQKCWFCSEYNNDTYSWTKEDIDLIITKLKNIPITKQKIFVYLYGGEPTLNKNLTYLILKVNEIFKDRELFIQLQTNLSLNIKKLENLLIFTKDINFEICSSYHIEKQNVKEFSEKIKLLKSFNKAGFIFINTSFDNEKLFMDDFKYLITNFPELVKLRFTEINKRNIKDLNIYPNQGKNINFKYFEYEYFIKKYPYFKNYFEDSFNFEVTYNNNKKETLNFSEVLGKDLNKFKYFKCQAINKNIVINYDLKVSWCQLHLNKNLNTKYIKDYDFSTFKNYGLCMVDYCTQDLEYTKEKL